MGIFDIEGDGSVVIHKESQDGRYDEWDAGILLVAWLSQHERIGNPRRKIAFGFHEVLSRRHLKRHLDRGTMPHCRHVSSPASQEIRWCN